MNSPAMPIDEVHARLRDALARHQLNGWVLGFAKGFVATCNRGGAPTAKQEACARRIVAELRLHRAAEGEESLIDEGG